MAYQPSLFNYDYSQGMPPRPADWPPISWEEMNIGDLSSGIYGANADNRYVSVPEGMRERISDATYVDEGGIDPEGSYPMPAGRDQGPLQYRDPQQYYMENRPYDYDRGWRGPVAGTGLNKRSPYVEYEEQAFHPYDSWEGRELSKADQADPHWMREREYNPLLQRALISQNRENLYGNEGITGLDVQETMDPEGKRILPMDELINPDFNIDWLEKTYGDREPVAPKEKLTVRKLDEEEEEEGITKGDKWRNFLSKITRQPYRPAMGGVNYGGRDYSPAQLNKLNALGGWYSEPARAARRTQSRIDRMAARREAGKSYSQKNLEALTGRDEGRGSYTATPTRSISSQGPGVTASSGMHGGRHYAIGGRVGYNTGGRVGILSVF